MNNPRKVSFAYNRMETENISWTENTWTKCFWTKSVWAKFILVAQKCERRNVFGPNYEQTKFMWTKNCLHK